MFKFKITKQSKNTLARTGIIETSHGQVHTPAFMPCATVGSVKGISSEELKALGYELILANTYHLYLRPGDETIKKLGGIQKFMNWPGATLTDSGGYQVFSLSHGQLAKVVSCGVNFRSHLDGSKHLFTPQKVIDIQKNLGADIAMVLDECTEYPVTHERAAKSMAKTHQWAKQAIEYWQKNRPKNQALFGIIQGSTYQDLRVESARYISNLPFDGIAVGGVSVGEGKEKMYEVIKWLGPKLPPNKPHYLMGVGEPEDIIEAVKWGFDLFDCVLPTRLGRHGTVWVTSNWKKFSKIDLRRSQYLNDKKNLIDGYSLGYISHLIREKEILGLRLATLHNLSLIQETIKNLRQTI